MTAVPSPRVLYAEDDENDVFFMERAFSRLKLRHTLHVVLNGREAVDYLAGQGAYADRTAYPLPDLVLLDVKMPQMSGLEVLKWARAQAAFQRLPIVLFTSSTQHSDIEFSRAHQASAYLVKRSNAQELSTLVSNILEACTRPLGPGENRLMLEGNLLGS